MRTPNGQMMSEFDLQTCEKTKINETKEKKSMTHTENYKLSQWQKSDRIMMSDFNSDNQKLDTALKTIANAVENKAEASALSALAATVSKITAGSYTGNGEESQTITLGFQPSAVLLLCDEIERYKASGTSIVMSGGIALYGKPLYVCTKRLITTLSADCVPAIAVTENGFSVYLGNEKYSGTTFYAQTNLNNYCYRYIAIG